MAIYHLNASTGSKAGGQSAAAKAGYLARAGKYSRDREEVAHVESGNMPAWVGEGRGRGTGAALDYWRQADEAERANGVLFRQVEFALPRELDEAQRLQLAREFAEELATVEGGKLPYTFAIHDKAGNPHVHLMLSERVNDGIERSAETWFKRAANQGRDPASGGARKADIASRRGDWLRDTRYRWSLFANHALAAAGRAERVDWRSHAERGLASEPGWHLGPAATGYERRTGEASMQRWRHEQADQVNGEAERRAVGRLVERDQAKLASEPQRPPEAPQAASVAQPVEKPASEPQKPPAAPQAPAEPEKPAPAPRRPWRPRGPGM